MRRSVAAAFLFLLWVGSACADPFTPTGAGASALGLAGMGRAPNANVLFLNPAALGDILNSDFAANLDDIADARSISAAGAMHIAKTATLGMGFRTVSVGNTDESQLLLSSSLAPSPLFWPGFSVKYLFANDVATLDLDLACVWNPFRRLRISPCLENVLGSSDGRKRTRSASLGIQYFWTPYAVDGFQAFFHSEIETLSYNAGFAVEKRFFKNPQFGLRMGGYLQRDSLTDDGMTLGAVYQHDLHQQRFAAEYAFRTSSATSSGRHSVSLHFGLWGGRDRVPPEIFIQPSLTVLTPNGDGDGDVAYFQLKAQDDPQGAGFHSWSLVIASRDTITNRPCPVKSFVAGGIPPSTIAWDARNSQGRLVEPGDYFYQFTATDRNANQAKTEWRIIRVQ